MSQSTALTFFRLSASFCFSVSNSKLTFSRPSFVWLQKRLGGGLQTACPAGIWKATALVFTAVNTCLDTQEILVAEPFLCQAMSLASQQ